MTNELKCILKGIEMPGFKTDIVCTEVIGSNVHVTAQVDWFLENIVITADCIFPFVVNTKAKTIDGVSRAVQFKQIDYDTICAACKYTLGSAITMSIKKKTENEINR
tara:strand:- start:26269 stop:26589 length:321 start_codon:yes stop_codon:yes gene_type:complete